MKKIYTTPAVEMVNFAAEESMLLTLSINEGTKGDVAESNAANFDQDWDEE